MTHLLGNIGKYVHGIGSKVEQSLHHSLCHDHIKHPIGLVKPVPALFQPHSGHK